MSYSVDAWRYQPDEKGCARWISLRDDRRSIVLTEAGRFSVRFDGAEIASYSGFFDAMDAFQDVPVG